MSAILDTLEAEVEDHKFQTSLNNLVRPCLIFTTWGCGKNVPRLNPQYFKKRRRRKKKAGDVADDIHYQILLGGVPSK